jgi:hypothetical protein
MFFVATDRPRAEVVSSIPRVAGSPREGDCVADVGEAGDVGERALEAEAKEILREIDLALSRYITYSYL